VGGIASDSMGAPRVGDHAFAVAGRLGTSAALVPGEAVLAARHWLWDRCRVLAEPGGAVALAGVMTGAVPYDGDVVVVVSGGNHSDIPEPA
jgi:threonine dehydratase